MKCCRPDASRGLKRRKDEGRIVSVEDDVLKRLLELLGKRMFKCLTTFALSYLRNGGDTLSLQRIMGHTDLTMTKRYVAYTLGDIKEQHAKALPVDKLVPVKKRVGKVKDIT